MKKGSKVIVVFVAVILLFSFVPMGERTVTKGETDETSDRYLKAALMAPIVNLNSLSITDEWSSNAVREPIYEGLSSYHQESKNIVPWLAYDWSPIGSSGSGEYDPSKNYDPDGNYDPTMAYIDPDLDTVANEALPSDDLEVVVRIRPTIAFHRAMDWFDSGETWQSPYSSFTMPGEKMEFLTAHDVVFSAEMLQWEAPLYQAGYLPLLQGLKGNYDIADPNWAINGGTGMYEGLQLYQNGDGTYDYSMKFTLKEPYSMFYVATFPTVMPMKVWAEHTLLNEGRDNALYWDCGMDGTTRDQKENLAGTGPYMWNEMKEDYVKVERNPNYWMDRHLDSDKQYGTSLKDVDLRPSFDGIKFVYRLTTDAAVISLKNGEIDTFTWNVDPGYISDIQNNPDTDVMSTPDFGFFYMAFNMEVPAFGYKNHPGPGAQLGTYYGEDTGQLFREAIAHATDKNYIVNTLLQGYGTVGSSVVSPDNQKYYNTTVKTYRYDLEKAEELLVQQNGLWQEEFPGFPAWDPDSGDWFPIPRRDSSGDIYADTDPFDLITTTATYDPIRAKAGIMIADTLRYELNINIRATAQNFQTLVGNIDPGVRDFDVYILGWSIAGYESLGSIEAFFHSRYDKTGGYNMPGFRNESFDTVIENAEEEMDPEVKIRLVKQLQGIISKKLPYNVLYYRDNINGYRKEWRGWVSWPGGIWNGYSLGYLHYGSGKTVFIKAPSEISPGEKYDIVIDVIGAEDYPSGIELDIYLNGNGGGLEFEDDKITDNTGRINATFTAPDTDDKETITLTAKIVDAEGYNLVGETEGIHEFVVNQEKSDSQVNDTPFLPPAYLFLALVPLAIIYKKLRFSE